MTDRSTEKPIAVHRFPIVPAVIWAMGTQTLRQCIRRKVLLVLLFFFVTMLVGSRVIPAHNPVKRVEMLIKLSLHSISFFGIIVAIFLAASVLPDDRAAGTITTVLTKPVGRLNYLLGRIFGFAMTLGIILLVMGVVSWGFIRWAGAVAAAETGRDDILLGKRGLEPTQVARYEGDEHKLLREGAKAAVLSGSEDVRIVYWFRSNLDRLPETDNQTIELLPHVATSLALPQVKAEIIVYNPATGDNVPVARTLNSEQPLSVTFPSRLVDPINGVKVVVRRLKSATRVSFQRGAFQLMIAPAPFEWSYLKALTMVFIGFLLVVVVSITASTFLSSWVAVLFAFSAYFFAEFHEVLRDLMAGLLASIRGESAGLLGSEAFRAIHHVGMQSAEPVPDPLYVTVLNYFMYGALWVLTHVFPNFNTFDPAGYLKNAHDVPTGAIGFSLLIFVCYGICYVILGHVVFWRRELAP